MAKITEYLEIYTKEYLLQTALKLVDNDVDTRQGSPVYDTLSIFCTKMADVIYELKTAVEQSYIQTATWEDMVDMRVAERGVTRYPSTQSERLGVFTYPDDTPANIPIGAIFCTIDSNKDNVVNFIVDRQYTVDNQPVAGSYILKCQKFGTVGNTYFGEILPISDVDTLGSATLTTIITPARDKEENESVKQRYFDTFEVDTFGGNIADYKRYIDENFSGVGQRQIYPRVQGSPYTIISCVDPSNQPISPEYQNTIKEQLDPENYYNNGNNTEGMGLGIVPIGHRVMVTTPIEQSINIGLTVIYQDNISIPAANDAITESIRNYIEQVQNEWQVGDGSYNLVVYYNRVLTAAINSFGVRNITSCTVNGGTTDITFTQSREQQIMPKLGTVTMTEA